MEGPQSEPFQTQILASLAGTKQLSDPSTRISTCLDLSVFEKDKSTATFSIQKKIWELFISFLSLEMPCMCQQSSFTIIHLNTPLVKSIPPDNPEYVQKLPKLTCYLVYVKNG